MISLTSLAFAYPHQPPLFSGLNWAVGAGEAWVILGPSGCGKSTLLYLLAGLRRPTAGEIWIDAHPLTRPRPRTGLVLQDFGLLPWATCEANISLGLRIHRFYGPDGKHAPLITTQHDIQTVTAYWLDRMGLTHVRGHYPSQLSGGQRQRAAIARTLALRPDVLLMDEPFASLDAPTRESLQALTLDIRAEQNLTTIVVTHSIEEAAFLGQKILVLGGAPDIIENPAAGNAEYRGTAHYNAVVQTLRERIAPTPTLPRPQSARTGEGDNG